MWTCFCQPHVPKLFLPQFLPVAPRSIYIQFCWIFGLVLFCFGLAVVSRGQKASTRIKDLSRLKEQWRNNCQKPHLKICSLLILKKEAKSDLLQLPRTYFREDLLLCKHQAGRGNQRNQSERFHI
ncbi:hypothetical protein AV530_015456 [Patagioenas fasciata monilis]|uniref:Uncharacterized protein n=1 Tax=Patagioenas fasciata monilis TaxID=372326 RepID=A0A1V4KRP9_PATFA|nr:hypothetical protein AV530_015456 [Patagioenas fasciata monilis]